MSLANLAASHEMHANKRKNPFPIPAYIPDAQKSHSQNTALLRPRPHSIFDLRLAKSNRLPSVVVRMRDKNRDVSISTQLKRMDIKDNHHHSSPTIKTPQCTLRLGSPSRLPKPATPIPPVTPSHAPTPTLRCKSTVKKKPFLTIDSDIEAFDPDEQYKDFKRMFEDYKQMHQSSMDKIDSARQESNIYKESLSKLEQEKLSQTESMIQLKSENQMLVFRIETAESSLVELRKNHESQVEATKQDHLQDIERLKQEQKKESEALKTEHKNTLCTEREVHLKEMQVERAQKLEALDQASTRGTLDEQRHQLDLHRKDQEIATAKLETAHSKSMLAKEKQCSDDLRKSLVVANETIASMDTMQQGLQAKIAFLESDSKSQSESYAAMERRMNEAIEKADQCEQKLRKEESIRRRLHNQVQELKGNIRVFCRVRPTLSADEELARMKYPDPEESTEIEVRGMDEVSSLGKDVTKTHPFTFDRVFDSYQTNDDVFREISQLIQSALDGYNVCIFAYGQTGSGKTYTMSAEDGMIPRALRQIYSTSKELEDRGWTYQMEGSFVEVYNEDIRDLLGDDEKSNKKHEVHHDMANHETTITNITTLSLDNQDQVEAILTQAMSRRSVAATKANEHSSRSHSVFILKLSGENSITGEKSKGTLNLVDLAGSERIRNADTSGQRLKETQSINKSLSCLGDVIGALGQQGQTLPPASDIRSSLTAPRDSSSSATSTAHIPYRNSKLTYLLQFSLGGNSKTLMFVMVAPEKKCLGETITSLKFAEKVSRTRVGVAKRVK